MNKVRVRFAPSPTGSLHVGGARTALFNYLFAKAQNGSFILRVEDTDQDRSTEEALSAQIRDLKWLGINWDEGPDCAAAYGPYRQSERTDIYKKIADELLQKGMAYYCFLTEQEIEEFRLKKQPWNSPYRNLTPAEAQAKIDAGAKPSIRFKTPAAEKIYEFNDIVRGDISLSSKMIGDFVIIRSGGMPVYNFCCAVDDHLMAISHVFRGEEHLSNSLRQLMIYEALGAEPPIFGHLSIILGADKKKLSKRQGAVSCDAFRQQGYLPEALLNYIAFLGWSPKTEQELFSKAELCEVFRADQLNAAAPIFDIKKLDWLNSQHIKSMPELELFARLQHCTKIEQTTEQEWQIAIMQLLSTDVVTLQDMATKIRPYLDNFKWQKPDGFADVLMWDSTAKLLLAWQEFLEADTKIDYASVENFLNDAKSKFSVKGKYLFMPLRAAVIGALQGADVRIAAPLISRASLKARVKSCLEHL